MNRAEIQRLKSLAEAKHRRAEGLYVVEGPKVVAELLREGVEFAELYATDEWQSPAGAREPVRVTPEEMARISHFPTPSCILAVGRLPRETGPAAGELDTGWTLALDGIQDPGNVGTLLRIADWFGFARLLLSPACADLFSQKVINASMGSFARLRVHRGELAPWLRDARVPVLGCDLHGTPLRDHRPTVAGIVVLGSEGRGLSPEVDACLTVRLTIPRLGRAESLNAAVAAGIVCAHVRGVV